MIVNTSKGQKKVKILEGMTILQLLQEEGIYLSAICGGRGTCGKCKIKVLSGDLPITLNDKKFFSKEDLERGYRLACSAYPTEDLEIAIGFSEEGFSIVSEFNREADNIDHGYEILEIGLDDVDFKETNSIHLAVKNKLSQSYQLSFKGLHSLAKVLNNYIHSKDIATQKSIYLLIKEGIIVDVFYEKAVEIYGVAIDIGTTTLGFHLVDLQTGEIKGTYSKLNTQRMYGADVISRIQSATSGNLDKLKSVIINDITTGIEMLSKDADIDNRFIYEVVIAGNTTMLHLVLGLSPESIGKYPFTSTTLSLMEFSFEKVFNSSLLDCKVSLLPGIDAFVGADITAGILHHDLFKSEKVNMLIDIGTNGEIVIGNKERILATATAAGPALEGGKISCGTGGVVGAISSVVYDHDAFVLEVIGDQKPIGICGSGIIDTIAEGVKYGWIDHTGRLSKTLKNREIVIYHDKEGNDIKLTQKDIREIQMAKSALRSGIECLVEEYGVSFDRIEHVYIAGGFGSNINIESSAQIGLIPKELKDKVSISGNSSLGGTIKYLLDKKCKTSLDMIVDKSKAINLSTTAQFNNLFIKNMNFEVYIDN